jgi:cytoskeletal protein CcmA (bactofilin family)
MNQATITASTSNGKNNLSIGKGVTFVGSIFAKGKADISGTVSGEIEVDELVVGVSGVMSGKITAREMNVLGKLQDEIICAEYACIHSTGVISGKFIYGDMEIHKGGRLIGLMNRGRQSKRLE